MAETLVEYWPQAKHCIDCWYKTHKDIVLALELPEGKGAEIHLITSCTRKPGDH